MKTTRQFVAALGFLLATSLGLPADAPSNEAIIRRYFEAWVNRADTQTADELIATSLVMHHGEVVSNGLDTFKQSITAFHVVFPDVHFQVEDLISEGEKVLVRWLMTGTQQGEFMGQPGSGKKVRFTGMSLFLIQHGKIQEIWVNLDRLAFLQQLGLATVGVPASTTPARAGVFPLKVSTNRRYLLDQQDRPFLVVGDTAWSLVAQLNANDIATYLDDRQTRGFNAIIVNLLEHKFADRAPADIAGAQPFLVPGDFSRPNPEYFAHARDAVAEAGRRGIAVWLCPAYLGWKGGDEGFFQEIKRAGPAVLRGYGRFAGDYFKDLPNIVWMLGGDYAVPEAQRWVGRELALGLREGGAHQLMTAHGGQTTAVETFGDQSWLSVDSVYRYQEDLWRPLQANWLMQPTRPYVLIESAYEGEHRAQPSRIRAQAWWSVTCGACGQFFGNNPIWYFDGPGFTDFKSAPSWQEALDLAGSRDMSRLATFLASCPWPTLVPDLKHRMVTAGADDGGTFITAARSDDGGFAIVYVPANGKGPREFTLNLDSFPEALSARWFNPARDEPMRALDPAPRNEANQRLRTPGDNGAGANDWVLVLEAED